MRSLLSPLFLWLMLVSFLTEMAFSLFLHFPGFLTELGAGEFEIGALYAVAAGVGVALRPWMGRLVDQRERRGVIIAAGLVNVSALLAYLTIDSFGVAVFVVAAVNASAQILLATAFFTFASEIVPTSRRTQGLALFGISFMLPIGLAGLLGDGILAIAGFDVLFLAAALFAIGSIAIVLTLSEPQREPDSSRRSFFAALRQDDLRPLWLLAFFVALGATTLFTFLRTFVDETGVGSVGLFFGAFAFTAVLVRLSASWIPDRVGQKRVLGPAVAANSVAFGLLASADSTVELVAAAIVGGVSAAFIFPILSWLIVTRARVSERGSAIAILIAVFDLAILAGGPTVGAIIENAGYPTAFATVGVTVAVGTVGFFIWDGARGNGASLRGRLLLTPPHPDRPRPHVASCLAVTSGPESVRRSLCCPPGRSDKQHIVFHGEPAGPGNESTGQDGQRQLAESIAPAVREERCRRGQAPLAPHPRLDDDRPAWRMSH